MAQEGLVLTRVDDSLFTATHDGVEVGRAAVAIGDGVWEFYTTVTAPEYQGRGIAGQLVRYALEAAEAAGVKVIPSCWYVDGLMRRSSPRYDHLRLGHDVPAALEGDACRIAPTVVRRS